MLLSISLTELRLLASKIIEAEGCNLYDLEIVGSGQNETIRVYIDLSEGQKSSQDKEQMDSFPSVTVAHCAKVSKKLSRALDEKELISDKSYHLEVSSPGLERALKEPWHYSLAVGKNIKVKTTQQLRPEDSHFEKTSNQKEPSLRKKNVIQGILHTANENKISILSHGELWNINTDDIEKARVVIT